MSSSFLWPSDDGWPYPDGASDVVDLTADMDDDLMAIRSASSSHLFDSLDPLERRVLTARFGLDGLPARSMKELHAELGLPRAELKGVLGSGLAKLRSALSG